MPKDFAKSLHFPDIPVFIHREKARGSEKCLRMIICCVQTIAWKRVISQKLLKSMNNVDWQKMVDGLPVAVTLKSAGERRYLAVNAQALRLFGAEAASRVGRTDDELALPFAEAVRRREDDVLAQNSPAAFIEDLVSPEWGELIVRHTISPVSGRDGTPAYLVATIENLTEVKRTERLYSAIAETTPIPFAVARTDSGEVVYCNAPFAYLFNTTQEAMTGRKTPDLYYNPEDRQTILQKLASDGRIDDFELRLKRPDGKPFWALIHEKLEVIGGVEYIIAGIIDISKRKTAEARAKESEFRAKQSETLALESEQRLRELTAGVPGVIYQAVIPEHGMAVFTFISSGVKKLFNLEPRDVELNPEFLYSRINAEDFKLLKRAIADGVAAMKPIAMEARYKMPNGRTGWVSLAANPVKNAAGERLINGLMLDITDRKKADFELQKNRAVLSEAMEAAKLAVWELDFATMCFTLDERHLGLLEASSEYSEISLDVYNSWFVHAEDRALFFKSMTAVIETRESVHFEYRIERTSGEIRYALLAGRAVKDPDGAVNRVIGTVQDVTERRLVELERLERQMRIERQDEAINTLTKSDTLANGFIVIALNEVTEAIADTILCERVSVWLLDDEGTSAACTKLFERSKHAHTGGTVWKAADFPQFFALIHEDVTLAYENVADEPRLAECVAAWFGPNNVPSVMLVPVHRGGKMAGVIICESVGQTRPWFTDERNFVITVSDLVSLALEAKERRDAISKLKAKEAELNRAMRDLSTNRARLEDALNIAKLATWEFDLKTGKLTLDELHFKWMNTSKEALGGYSLPFKDWAEKYVLPEDLPNVIAEAEKIKTTDEDDYRASYEYRMKPVMEEVRYLQVTIRGIRDDKGKMTKAVGTTQDVTDRKKAELAEKALRERKERQQIALATLAKSDGVMRGNLEAAIRDVSLSVAMTIVVHRVGVWIMDGDALVCLDVFSADDNDFVYAPDIELENYPKFAEALNEGRPIAAQFAKFDPRTREFTEDFYSELGVASVLIVPVKYQGRVVGMLNIEHVGIPRAWFDDERAFAVSASDLVSLVIEAQNRRLAIERLEAKEAELSKLNDALQKTVTERTQAMESLKNAQNQLVQSEKMASLGLLIAGVAHEVNTPISAVKASARNLLRSLPVVLKDVPSMLQKLPEESRTLFFKLVEQSTQSSADFTSSEERAFRKSVKAVLDEYDVPDSYELAKELVEIRVVENIEDFVPLFEQRDSRELLDKVYTLGQFKKNLDNIDIAAEKTARVVRALKSYSHSQQQDKFVFTSLAENIDTILTVYANQLKYGINVVKNFADVPQVPVFPDEIGQVWTNVINNGVYAMKGKGTLTIDIGLENGMAFVRITDSGPGIPPEVQKRIFEPFFTTKPQGEGTGLGLDICRKIVEKHNGAIELDSVPGRTAFTVRLPLTQPEDMMESL